MSEEQPNKKLKLEAPPDEKLEFGDNGFGGIGGYMQLRYFITLFELGNFYQDHYYSELFVKLLFYS